MPDRPERVWVPHIGRHHFENCGEYRPTCNEDTCPRCEDRCPSCGTYYHLKVRPAHE